jgi:transcriptional regulator with XRE-family HTH domain
MTTVAETLGRRVQRLRVAAGLTQAQLAIAAGVPLSSLQNWEIDRREPSFRAACRLAHALAVTAEYLAETAPIEKSTREIRPAGPTPKVRSKKSSDRRGVGRRAQPRQKRNAQTGD